AAVLRSCIADEHGSLRTTLGHAPVLFPRIDDEAAAEQLSQVEQRMQNEAQKPEQPQSEQTSAPQTEEHAPEITIDAFMAVDIRVGAIIAAQEVPKSKKLLRLQVDLGEETPRQILAG